MNWKEEAEEKLRRYDAVSCAVKNLKAEIKQLEGEVAKLRRGKDPNWQDLLLTNQVRQRELKANLRRTGCWLGNVDRALGALNPEEKLVLYRMYVNPQRGKLAQLCGDLNVEQSSVYRRRDKALQKFTFALYGIGEN